MAERLVLCGGCECRGDGDDVLRLALHGPNRNVRLRLHDISRPMVADVPDPLVDLLEIAAYVHSADGATRRGGPAMRSMGADWRRRFHFVIPVRHPEVWTSAEVIEALTETLGFLSDDDYRFDFVLHPGPPPIQHYFAFRADEPGDLRPEEVVLFSGGLDSLAGAVEEIVGRGKRVALVSHQSSPKIVARQKELVRQLGTKASGPPLHVPVQIIKAKELGREFTLRSRSFLFAALAAVVGRMLGSSRIRFFENGVVSLNLPFAAQVLGARATRTTHPRVLDGFRRFFTALFEAPFAVDNAFAWKTKAEVIGVIAAHGCAELIASSVSCAHVHRMTNAKTHCGVCSQCLDRRFAVLAAGVAAHDPEERYAVRLLQDEREAGAERTMAEAYVRSAVEIRRMDDLRLVGRYAGELSRAVRYLPGAPDDNARRIVELLRRHADEIVAVLEGAVRDHARDLVDHRLPPHCLLRMAVAPGGEVRLAPEPACVEPAPAAPAEEPQAGRSVDTGPPEIRIALDDEHRRVLVAGLPPLEGDGAFKLLTLLAEAYRRDQAQGRAPENYGYVASDKLAKDLGIEEPSLRRRVLRLRKTFFKQYEAAYGLPLSQEALIQSQRWRGYRLNPAVRVLSPGEIDAGPPRHDSRAGRHDSPPHLSNAAD